MPAVALQRVRLPAALGGATALPGCSQKSRPAVVERGATAPARNRLTCPIDDHGELGMHATLIVR